MEQFGCGTGLVSLRVLDAGGETGAAVDSDLSAERWSRVRGPGRSRSFAQAEFADIRFERLEVELPYENEDHALNAAFRGRPVALAYSRFDASTSETVHGQYLRSIEPYREGSGYRAPADSFRLCGRCALFAIAVPSGYESWVFGMSRVSDLVSSVAHHHRDEGHRPA